MFSVHTFEFAYWNWCTGIDTLKGNQRILRLSAGKEGHKHNSMEWIIFSEGRLILRYHRFSTINTKYKSNKNKRIKSVWFVCLYTAWKFLQICKFFLLSNCNSSQPNDNLIILHNCYKKLVGIISLFRTWSIIFLFIDAKQNIKTNYPWQII